MENQSIDEATRREACERVKEIVKAIKAIKIKYYSVFSKISPQDKEKYQKLENALNKISDEHNLNNLKVALMQEVEIRYNGEKHVDFNQEEKEPDYILQACYGAIDAQKDALSKGRITQALRCQEMLKIFKEKLDDARSKEVTNYKREKFAELMQSREQLEEQIKLWNNSMKGMFKITHVQERKDAMEMIKNIQTKEISPSIEGEMEIASI